MSDVPLYCDAAYQSYFFWVYGLRVRGSGLRRSDATLSDMARMYQMLDAELLIGHTQHLQGYLPHKNLHPPEDHHRALCIGLL